MRPIRTLSVEATSGSSSTFVAYPTKSSAPTTMNSTLSGNTSDEVFQLRLELNSLRQRVKVIDDGATKLELLDLLEVSKEEISAKNKQLSALNDKFHQITKSITQLELDHDVQIKTITTLESDNKRLTRHLSIREKEISTLVARCSAQEEKLAGVKDARMLEKTLNHQINELTRQIQDKDSKLEEFNQLQLQLLTRDKDIFSLQSKVEELEVKNTKDCAALLNLVSTLEKQVEEANEEKEAAQKKIDFMVEERNREKKEQEKAIEALELEIARSHDREESLRKSLEDNSKKTSLLRTEADEELRLKTKEASELKVQLMGFKLESDKVLQDTTLRLVKEKENAKIKYEMDLECKEQLITSLNRHVTALKDSNESLARDLHAANKQREELSTLRREDVENLEQSNHALADKVRQKEEDIRNHLLSISQLNEDLMCCSKEIDRLKSKVATLEGELSDQRRDLQGRISESQVHLRDLESKLLSEQDTSHSLRKQLMDGKDLFEQQKLSLLDEIKTLHDSVQKLKIQNTDNEKESKRTLILLKESNDEVASLKNQISQLVIKEETTELQAAELVDELERKISTLKASADATDDRRLKEIRSLETTVASSKSEISSLQSHIDRLENIIKTKDSSIDDHRFKLETMTKEMSDQDNKMTSLRSELEILILAYDKLKKEFSQKVAILETELLEEKERATEDAAVFREDFNRLQAAAAQTDEWLDQKDSELQSTKALLAERTKLLSDMVVQNKLLEQDLKEARTLVTELQDDSENYIHQKETAEAAVVKLKNEIDRMEDSHIGDLQKERSLRLSLEEDLKKAKALIDASRVSVREYNDMEKEVEVLKDKVKRQENYLKKKLQQEKALKERIYCPKSPERKKSSSGSRLSDGISLPDELEVIMSDDV